MREIYLSAAAAFVGAALLTWLVRHFALLRGVIDYPNARSSHSVPTPRGGGLAIVIATSVAILWLASHEVVDRPLAFSVLGGGLLVALVGFLDDRGKVSVQVRFVLHLLAATWSVWCIGGLPELQVGEEKIDLGLLGDLLGVLSVAWALNLFNFMDGIDGIAASEAAFMAMAGAVLSVGGVSAGCVVLSAASLGFLVWNWPPAKIFMGDAGSGYLGYVLAVLALNAARDNPAALYAWLILGGVFFVDATVTLIRRLLGRERVYQAHRSHAYQIVARHWGSHRRVTVIVGAINVLWLFPMAWLGSHFPSKALWCVIAGLSPLAILVLGLGAGRDKS